MDKKKEFSDLLKEANEKLQKEQEDRRSLDVERIIELQNRQKALLDILSKRVKRDK